MPSYLTTAKLSETAYKLSDNDPGGVNYIIRGNIIAIRGTEKNYEDILRDMRTFPWPTQYGIMHAGFWKGAQRLASDPEVNCWAQQQKPLIATGHSLGGAIALALAIIYPSINTIHTYGAPRLIFSKGPQDILRKRAVRQFTHGIDIVPEIPRMLGFSRHVNMAMKLPEVGSSRGIFADHRIKRYVAATEILEGA